MSEKIDQYGTCENCGNTTMLVKKFNSMQLCKYCLPQFKEGTPEKVKAIEDPIEKFNALIRRTQNNS